MTTCKINNRVLGIRQTPLTLQQRLAQLLGAKLNTLINPFGNIEDAQITKVAKSVIVLKDIILSPTGTQVFSINRRAIRPTKQRFNITLNVKVSQGEPNNPGFLNNRKFVQIGKDFIETTVNGSSIELIPLSNVTVIFPSPIRIKKWKKIVK